ncbi:hypothetical protein [Janthinobacterium sp.]|uniref:hypothetical protein n=1 Tax=Janthinobacterium sp. TaxID=1871054 RepID=UPI00262E1AC8|nr:hypothetical protein [Janthinobacterium sp.]
MRKTAIVLALAIFAIAGSYYLYGGLTANRGSVLPQAEATPAVKNLAATEKQSDSADSYSPPTEEELAPMRPEYLAELAKIVEPPEMANKPMQVRKSPSSSAVKAMHIMSALGSPEKASHSQRTAAINGMLELVKNTEMDENGNLKPLYGALAVLACLDGADPQAVIGYANNAIGGETDDVLALRARMYLKAGKVAYALDDLEKIMRDRNERALVDGEVNPRKDSVACGWSIADFDALGSDPRALAAKGIYLSSFISFGAISEGVVEESDIRDLYTRSAKSWRSPIPHYLFSTLYGLGSEHFMRRARCIRESTKGGVQENESACAQYDEGLRQQIRELTMSLVIEPTFLPALSLRASKYLSLAQGGYAEGRPSAKLYALAIKDFTAAIAAGGKDEHVLYCDRALAEAAIGLYRDAAVGYEQCMQYAKNGVEDDPFVYMQLAGLYLKMGRFNEAADLITQAIMNASGGGMDVVIFTGGIKGFRALYPEYELLPDDILAEAVRRRYFPGASATWNARFISQSGKNEGKVISSILPELYILRGDAYMKAGKRKQAMADYRRVKSSAWSGNENLMPQHIYFDERGNRDYNAPEPFPASPAKL